MEIIKAQTVSFSGHRTSKLQIPTEELYNKIYRTIERLHTTEGYIHYLTGMAIGYDMLAAIAVMELKLTYPDIKLIAAVPFAGQELRYSNEDKKIYKDIIEQCDDIVVICDEFSYSAYFKRNDFLLANSSKLVCYFNGSAGGTKYTYDKAIKAGLPVINLYQE